MSLTSEQQKEFDSFCQRLMSNQIAAPNEFVEYMVTRLQQDRIQYQRLQENLINLKERIHQLSGGIRRYETDIDEFVMRHLFDEEEKKPDLELVDGDKEDNPEESTEVSS